MKRTIMEVHWMESIILQCFVTHYSFGLNNLLKVITLLEYLITYSVLSALSVKKSIKSEVLLMIAYYGS